MTLLITNQGPLGSAIQHALAQAGTRVDVVPPDHDDLFGRALDQQELVYVASSRLIDGIFDPKPDPDRARAVMKASVAPGVSMVVFILPNASAFDVETEVLERDGKPYVIVKAPLLLEEVAEVLASDPRPRIWAPQQGQVSVTTAAEVGRAVIEALKTERQGRTTYVEGEKVNAASLLQRAAALGSSPAKVQPVWPWLFRMARPLARLVLGQEPRALALCDRVIALS